MGQAKMIRRCFPVKQSYCDVLLRNKTLMHHKQNLESQFITGQTVGSPGLRSYMPVQPQGFSSTAGAHSPPSDAPAHSLRCPIPPHPSRDAPSLPPPKIHSPDEKFLSSCWKLLEAMANLILAPQKMQTLLDILLTSLLYRLTSDNPHSARNPHLHHWIILWRSVMGRQVALFSYYRAQKSASKGR